MTEPTTADDSPKERGELAKSEGPKGGSPAPASAGAAPKAPAPAERNEPKVASNGSAAGNAKGAPASKPELEGPPEDEGMTFWEHLEELRSRLFKMALAATLGAGAAWFLHTEILDWLLAPFQRGWARHFEEPPEIHFPNPAGLFVAYLKLSMMGGLIFALPIIFYQLWAFIAPGLYAREKRFALPFVGASTLLFCTGVFFAMKFVFPQAFAFLLGMVEPAKPGGVEIKPTIMVEDYVSFVTQMLLAFGAVFELPVVAFFLSVAGVIDHTHLIKFFRYFVVIAFVLGALLTPPDLLSQFFMAIPLIVLYGLSIGVAWVFGRKRKKA